MYIADTLSRAYLPAMKEDEKRVEMEQVNLLDHLPIAKPLLEKLKQCTSDDGVMKRATCNSDEWMADETRCPVKRHAILQCKG